MRCNTCWTSNGLHPYSCRKRWRKAQTCTAAGTACSGRIHVPQVEAELRFILVEPQVSCLKEQLSDLEDELADVRTQRDILMRP